MCNKSGFDGVLSGEDSREEMVDSSACARWISDVLGCIGVVVLVVAIVCNVEGGIHPNLSCAEANGRDSDPQEPRSGPRLDNRPFVFYTPCTKHPTNSSCLVRSLNYPTMPLPQHSPRPSASGITADPTSSTGARVIPASVRPDGTVRKERKVKPGFTPQEDVGVFKPRALRERDSRAVPGAAPPRNGMSGRNTIPRNNTNPSATSVTPSRSTIAPEWRRAAPARAPTPDEWDKDNSSDADGKRSSVDGTSANKDKDGQAAGAKEQQQKRTPSTTTNDEKSSIQAETKDSKQGIKGAQSNGQSPTPTSTAQSPDDQLEEALAKLSVQT